MKMEFLADVNWEGIGAIVAILAAGGVGATQMLGRRKNGKTAGGAVCAIHREFEKRLEERHKTTTQALERIEGGVETTLVKTLADEKAWRRAKQRVSAQYGNVQGDRKWKLVTTIFKNMRGKKKTDGQ
jgi:hypothetical protein